MCEVQNRVTQQHQQLFVLSSKQPGQRLLAGLGDDAFPHPLPELSLRRPKLLSVAAHDQRGLLLLFLLFIGLRHLNTRPPLRSLCSSHTGTPKGSLSCEAAASCQNGRRTHTPAPSQCLRIRRVFDSATEGSVGSDLGVTTVGSSLKSTIVSVNH